MGWERGRGADSKGIERKRKEWEGKQEGKNKRQGKQLSQ